METLWEKEKILVTGIFSFSYIVFKSFRKGPLKSGWFYQGLQTATVLYITTTIAKKGSLSRKICVNPSKY